MSKIEIQDGESLDAALRRFRKTLQKTGVLQDVRRHERYEKPSDRKRKARAKAARKRAR